MHTINLAVLDGLQDSLGGLSIDLAANTLSSSQHLPDGSLQLLGERLEAHGAGNLNDLIEADGLVVLDVLLLLAVTRGLLEGLDDERGGSGHDRDGSLTVLDGQLDGDTETFLFMALAPRSAFCKSTHFLTQSPVALAISSPTFLGDRPRGPILGARAEEAPTSPPVARRWL